jgi:hypothetical protein
MKAFCHITKAIFLQSRPPAVGWGYSRENCFYMYSYRRNILNIFSRTMGAKKLK